MSQVQRKESMVTSLGPLLQLMRNGTIPPADADEIMYYLQLNATGKNFAAKFRQSATRKLTDAELAATPADD